MTHEEKLKALMGVFARCIDIADAKGRDYSGTEDGMGNFRQHGSFGIIVRMHDKMSRLNRLVAQPRLQAVVDESITDTLLDLINYAALAAVMRRLESEE